MGNKLIIPEGKVIPFEIEKWNFIGQVKVVEYLGTRI